jgi:hypothetical protein
MKFLTVKPHKVIWHKQLLSISLLSMMLAASPSTGASFSTVATRSESQEFPVRAIEPVSPDGAIEKIWIDYRAQVKGEIGIRIHTKFIVKNALNVGCSIQATVERADGNFMLSKSIGTVYRNGNKVLVLSTFIPPYDPATYPDTKLFIPNWAFNLQEDNPNKMKLTIVLVGESKQFARSSLEFEIGLGKAR